MKFNLKLWDSKEAFKETLKRKTSKCHRRCCRRSLISFVLQRKHTKRLFATQKDTQSFISSGKLLLAGCGLWNLEANIYFWQVKKVWWRLHWYVANKDGVGGGASVMANAAWKRSFQQEKQEGDWEKRKENAAWLCLMASFELEWSCSSDGFCEIWKRFGGSGSHRGFCENTVHLLFLWWVSR